jgi:hypothetical protein
MRMMAMSHLDTIGYLSSQAIDTSAICQATDESSSCDFQAYKLRPGNVVILLSNWSRPENPIEKYDHPHSGVSLRVGDMAAVRTIQRVGDDHLRLEWEIARPDIFGAWVQIEADIRGPHLSELRRQLAAMIASFRYEPPPQPLPDDDATARAIAATAITELRDGDPAAYECFPTEVGTTNPAIVEALPGGTLRKPLPVTCSMSIHTTDVGFWRMQLIVGWEAAKDRTAGAETTTQWLFPDGRITGSEIAGDMPGSAYCCV